ncbi:MAG: hypothetical protein A3B70_06570 [Deltaproteobacteria bacterium RIFCSPHIGHO2_02_FULL_40_11]|nr:MAG: hypothetical protein A3B70_06570 [Deltaproteobacteria bacterium RIFCSPHIGHO2_02_FULL_40_11]
MVKKQGKSSNLELVQCDLEYPEFQNQLKHLSDQEFNDFIRCIRKIKQMTWQQIYQTSSRTQKRGLNWEVLHGQKTASDATIASIRVTQKFRARVTRAGCYMRFISLHPDHDSAYR